MNRGGSIAIDTETTGLDKTRAKVLFWSMATEDRRYFFPAKLLQFFDPLFGRSDIDWFLSNSKFDKHMLGNMGTKLPEECWDIVDMDAMDDDTRGHGLKDQAKFTYDVSWGEFKELFLDPDLVGKELGIDPKAFAQFKKKDVGEKLLFVFDEKPEIVEDYATCDAYFTLMLGQHLQRKLAATPLPTDFFPELKTQLDYYVNIEKPLTPVLFAMERAGIHIDMDRIKAIDGPMRDGLRAAEQDVSRVYGKKIEATKNDVIREILFGKKEFGNYGLKPVKYSSSGDKVNPSVDVDVLEILQQRSETPEIAVKFITALLAHRKLKKVHSTYVENIGKHIGADGNIHCSFNQSIARTSRLSSSAPNLQNIPSRNDIYKVRSAYVAPELNGMSQRLVVADYPQIEFRVAAVLAGEESMMDSMRRNWDIHSSNAALFFKDDAGMSYEALEAARSLEKKIKAAKEANKPIADKLTELQLALIARRPQAKDAGLAVLYGKGARSLGIEIGVPKEEAQEIIWTIYNKSPAIFGLIKGMHAFGHDNEFTHTMLGRIRRLYRINSNLNGVRAEEERQALNTLIQGSSAEMLKLAMIQLYNNKDFRSLGAKMLLTVHDELVNSSPRDTAKDVKEVVETIMADPYNWRFIKMKYAVPLNPETVIVDRWSEAK